MDIEKLDINAVCFGILCNFTPVCGEERAKEAVELVRTLQAENEKLRAEQKRVKRERDAAVGDMEALMWHSGEGCQICANAVEVHKRPYVRLDCKLGSGIDCKPKWRGQKED